MTDLHRPVRRRIQTASGTALHVVLTPAGIELREPRRRRGYLLPYGVAFLTAVRLAVATDKAARKTKGAR